MADKVPRMENDPIAKRKAKELRLKKASNSGHW